MHDLKQQEEAIFSAAQQLTEPRQRAAFLDAVCAGNAELRRRLDGLLAAKPAADAFFERPPTIVLGAELSSVADAMGIQPADGRVAEPAKHAKPRTRAPGGMAAEVSGNRIGCYRLLEKLGEGGFGEVWVAEQKEPVKRRVALKIVKFGMDTKQVVARFEAERQALALMDHPNIAKVLDAGATDTGRPYFVMELVRGVRITDYCEQHALSLAERLDLFMKVCQAIQHAHQKGVIHRDIKPANILVTLHDGLPFPKVIDFGIAKATQQELTDKTLFTQFHQFIGTPAYMSPEQAEMSGLDIDTRSDIYSLGVLLYELLIGQTPFDSKELMALGLDAMRKTIREKEPVRPSTRLSQTLTGDGSIHAKSKIQNSKSKIDAPPASASAKAGVDGRRLLRTKETIALLRGDLDWIVMKCLEKDRARRYETANGLAMDIQRYLRNEPVLARPPSATYRLRKTIRRNRIAFAAAALVAAALVVGAVVSAWLAVLATRAKRTALAAEVAEKQQRLTAETAQAAEREQRLLAQQKQAEAEASDRRSQHLLYAASMNLAQQAWEQNNVARTRQMLEESAAHAPRGFEWYYLQQLIHLELRTLRGHLKPVVAAFSSDGRRIITAGEDHIVKIWDATSGRELFAFGSGHTHEIGSLAISPDGRRLLTGSNDHTAKLWDSSNGQELLTIHGHNSRVSSVAFSPEGDWFVTGGGDQVAKVWRTADGQELLALNGHSAGIRCVAVSRDGQRIATGSGDQTAKIWDATSGRDLFTLKEHVAGIDAVAFAPGNHWLATGSADQTAKLWDVATGKELLTLKGHIDLITTVAFSPDGQRVATGSADQSARVWEAASGKELFMLRGHEGGIKMIGFSPDGKRILTGSMDGTAKLWETSSKEALLLTGHTARMLWTVAFSADGERIVTSSGDQTARVWRASDGIELLTLRGHRSGVRSAAFSPNGQRIVTGSDDRTAKIWDAITGQELLTLSGHSNLVWSVNFSPDGQRVLTASGDHAVKVWQVSDGRELLTLEGHSDIVYSAAFSPDGSLIASGGPDNTVRLWDAATGHERKVLKGHSAAINSIAFSKDGRRFVTGSHDRTAKLWSTDTGEELLTFKGHRASVKSVVFSPDGHRIVTAGEDQTARVWEATRGLELLTLKGHRGGINSVSFSPEGRRIATAGSDQTARVWKAASENQVAVWLEEARPTALSPGAHDRGAQAAPSRGRD